VAHHETCGFQVRMISTEVLPDLNCYIVGLAEDADGEGASLVLSVIVEPEGGEQDSDTYYLGTAGGASAYGGVLACVLEGDKLELLLSPATAAALGLCERYCLQLAVDGAAKRELAAGLRRIFAGRRDAPADLRL
jgi:hypothetical protein